MEMSISFAMFDKVYVIPQTIVNSMIVVLFLSVLILISYFKVRKTNFKDKPKGWVHILEVLVESVDKLVAQFMGDNRLGFSPYIMTLMAFLVTSNTMGLFGFKPPTTDLNVTLSLAFITFVLIHYNKIKANGIVKSVKGYFEPVFLLFPINVVGDFSLVVSLSFRLFGNILSGMVLMTLVYAALGAISKLATPLAAPIFHAYFDLFAGVLQTFIFTMLSMVNISLGMGLEEN